MSTLDAGFYFVEHENVPMHIGSLVVFEGPAPSYCELAKLYEAKLPAVPRYRQVVRLAPFQLFRPLWVDDEHFRITNHVHQASVEPPGGSRQLQELAAQIFAQPLDRARPLWEGWLLTGLKGGRWAIISKVHHCMVDGVGGNDLMTEVFDATATAARRADPPAWQPERAPSLADQLAEGIRDAVGQPLRQLVDAPGFIRRRLPTPDALFGFVQGLTGSAQRLTIPSVSSLNGPIGPYRRWAWTGASLATVKEIRSAYGGTVNDVLLAVISRGFRDLLAARGELTGDVVVRSLVPVSVRGQDERGAITNRVSAVLANLPVGEADPVRRLESLRAQMDDLKRTHQPLGAELLTEVLGFAAPTLLAFGSRAAFSMGQPLVQTVTTNVPGPRFPLYVMGRRMVKIYPYVPIGDGVRISIAISSYLDRFTFGITADYDAVPDLGILVKGLRRGLAELCPRVGTKDR